MWVSCTITVTEGENFNEPEASVMNYRDQPLNGRFYCNRGKTGFERRREQTLSGLTMFHPKNLPTNDYSPDILHLTWPQKSY